LGYLIDTNIAIHLRDGDESVNRRFEQHRGDVALSALSLAELQRGLYKRPGQAGVRSPRLESILRAIPVIPFDAAAAAAYGLIIAQCGWVKGRDFDRMIAAHAISTRSILVTNNAADFRDVPNLSLENWATA
jgi:tRNA(fMet)-specific endonuclease VapC